MVRIYDIDGNLIKEYPELETLAGADLSYEDLMFADLRNLDLTDTNFHGADLFMADIEGSITDGTDFSNTYFEKIVSYGGGGHHEYIRGY